jgi:hypothetical protein
LNDKVFISLSQMPQLISDSEAYWRRSRMTSLFEPCVIPHGKVQRRGLPKERPEADSLLPVLVKLLPLLNVENGCT